MKARSSALIALICLILTPHARAQLYSLTDMGSLGGSFGTIGYSVNDSGVATGYSYLPGNGSFHAITYGSGVTTDLGTLGGTSSKGHSVNSSGLVVGLSDAVSGSHAFYYSGSMSDAGTLGGTFSEAWAGNNSGVFVGESTNGAGKDHAFMYSGGIMTDIGTLVGPSGTSVAYGINNTGTVVGESTNGFSPEAFSYTTGGGMVGLGTLGGTNSYAQAVNDSNLIVGYSYTASGKQHAFSYSGGVMTDLGVVGGFDTSQAFGVDENGDVVGSLFNTVSSTYSSFIYRGGTMYDLGTLLDASGAGWNLQFAYGISPDGDYIVGAGTIGASTTVHGFILTIPEPSACGMLVGGMGLLGLVLRRRKLHTECAA